MDSSKVMVSGDRVGSCPLISCAGKIPILPPHCCLRRQGRAAHAIAWTGELLEKKDPCDRRRTGNRPAIWGERLYVVPLMSCMEHGALCAHFHSLSLDGRKAEIRGLVLHIPKLLLQERRRKQPPFPSHTEHGPPQRRAQALLLPMAQNKVVPPPHI